MGTTTFHVRSIVWFVAGAVLAAAVTVMFMNAWRVDASPGDTDTTFVPITSCRLADTRPGDARVGQAAALGPRGTQRFAAHGTNGQCSIPTNAVAVAMNATALGASVQSFLTFWPDGDLPTASSLNPAPGEPPTPNAVTVDLSDDGGFNVYNDTGTVNLVLDITGYYIRSSLQELQSRLAAVEAAQAAGVDPAVLARISAVETNTATNAAGVATNAAGVATNAAGVATNAAGVATNAARVATNAAGVATNADAVAALDAAQPFTVFNRAPTTFTALSTYTDMIEVTVTAPVAGVVAVTSAVTAAEDTAQHQVRCGINNENATPIDADPGVDYTYWSRGTNGGGGAITANLEAMTATRAFDIAAGATVTYYLMCQNASGGSSTVDVTGITATFTPAT